MGLSRLFNLLKRENKAEVNRKTLLTIPLTESFLDAIVDNTPVVFFKTQPGIHFCITVKEEDIYDVASRFAAQLVLNDIRLYGDPVVGRIVGNENKGKLTTQSWPIVQDPQMASFVTKAEEKFWSLVDKYGAWKSFADYLKIAISYDPRKQPTHKESVLEYWWLVGRTNNSNAIHPAVIYPDKGVFIRPKDQLVPIFTSHLYACMAAYHYSKQYAVSLVPEHIECLGCFLGGFSKECGRKALKGAILNEQWNIKFFTCGESLDGKEARHFFLRDSTGEEYSLFRCKKDTPGPIWLEKRWDIEGSFFNPPCKLKKW